MGTLAKKLQAEPPPKIVKVTMSQKIPLTGEELQAYELEQRLKMATETEVDLVEEVGPNSPEAKAVTGPLPLTVAEPGGGVPLGVEGKGLKLCHFCIPLFIISSCCLRYGRLAMEVGCPLSRVFRSIN